MQKCFIFVKKGVNTIMLKIRKYYKIGDHCHYTSEYRGAAHSICNLTVCVTEETVNVFYSGSNYEYPFIKKYLAGEFEGKFTFLRESTKNI